MEKEQFVFDCEEEPIDADKQSSISLEEFDNHLERYLKVMQKDLTPQIFYYQFKMCYSGNNADFLTTYKEFKSKSRHLINRQLTLF